MFAIRTVNLSKRFGSYFAVRDLSLTVPKGAIYGFVGANAAGKTTTLRLMLGLLRPTSGRVEVGAAAGSGPAVGALIESPSLYPHLSATENLEITRLLLRLDRPEVARVLDVVGLSDAGNKRVGRFSLGMRQRLAIARALLGRPSLLVLDEPTNGLDPEGIVDMRALLRRIPEADGTTLIVSSHLLSEIEQVATHVGMIHRGALLLEAPLTEVIDRTSTLEVITGDQESTRSLLCGAGFSVAVDGDVLAITGGPSLQPQPEEVARLIVESGQSLRHIALRRASLERLYHHRITLAA